MNGSSRAWAGLVLVAGGLLAVPRAGGGCYDQQWFNPYQLVDGSCSIGYTECPKKVLCGLAPTGFSDFSTITTQQVACRSYINGEDAPGGGCRNGELLLPPTEFVSVHYQECKDQCP